VLNSNGEYTVDESGRIYAVEMSLDDDDLGTPDLSATCAVCSTRAATCVARFLQLDGEGFVLADRLEICGTCASDLENENVDAIDAAIRTAPESWPDEPGMGSLMIRSLRRIDR